jgi:hypothetical protein
VKISGDIEQLTSASVVTVVGSTTLLVVFALAFLSAVLGGAPVSTTTVFGAAVLVMGGILLSTVGRRLTLTDEYLESRDWLFRHTRVQFHEVERIDFQRGHQLTIWVSGGGTIAWPAKTSAIESFIGALGERITRVRPLEISGDLEVE